MKNIILSAEEHLIEEAKRLARSQRKTLNQIFREWLIQYTARPRAANDMDVLIKRLRNVRAGKQFTRNEINAR